MLYAKQGRAQQFTTQAARDQYLSDEIKQLKAYEKTQTRRISDLEGEVDGAKAQLSAAAERSAEQTQKDEERREKLRQMAEEVATHRAKVDSMQEQRKELWREDGKLGQTVANAREQLQTHERALQGMMDKDTANGLRAVRNYAQRLRLDGVYGPLYELFEVSDRYKTAVEVTAGNSLFHVVVDNDDTATRLLEEMTKDRAGRVTFMPLNRLRSHTVSYPKADDALPMISKLKFDRKYVMAFEQVFGRTIICEDLATAAQYTRSHGLNAVTVEGDRVDRKGALTGGFHDVRRSRLDSVKAVRRWQEVFNSDSARHNEVKEGLARLEQQVTTTLGQIQMLEAKRKQILEQRHLADMQSRAVSRDEEQARQLVSRLQSALEEARGELRDATSKRASYEEEMKTPMRQRLTDEEIAELEELATRVEEQKKTLQDAMTARQAASSERNKLEIELTEGLRRTRLQLRGDLDDLEGDAGAGVLQAGEVELRNAELRNIVRSIEQLSDQIKSKSSRALGCESNRADNSRRGARRGTQLGDF